MKTHPTIQVNGWNFSTTFGRRDAELRRNRLDQILEVRRELKMRPEQPVGFVAADGKSKKTSSEKR